MTFLVWDDGNQTLNSLEKYLDMKGVSFDYDGDLSDVEVIVMDPIAFRGDIEKKKHLKKYGDIRLNRYISGHQIPIFIYSNYEQDDLDRIGFKEGDFYDKYFCKSRGSSITFLVDALKPYLGIEENYKIRSPDDEALPNAV